MKHEVTCAVAKRDWVQTRLHKGIEVNMPYIFINVISSDTAVDGVFLDVENTELLIKKLTKRLKYLKIARLNRIIKEK